MTTILTVPVTAEEILEALERSETYRGLVEGYEDAFATFIPTLPTVLKDHLARPLTFDNLMSAREAYLAAYMTSDAPKLIGKKLGLQAGAIRQMIEGLGELLESFKEISADVLGFFAENGLTEEFMMTHPQGVGLSLAMLRLYKSGSATISDVLKIQPMLIIDIRPK